MISGFNLRSQVAPEVASGGHDLLHPRMGFHALGGAPKRMKSQRFDFGAQSAMECGAMAPL